MIIMMKKTYFKVISLVLVLTVVFMTTGCHTKKGSVSSSAISSSAISSNAISSSAIESVTESATDSRTTSSGSNGTQSSNKPSSASTSSKVSIPANTIYYIDSNAFIKDNYGSWVTLKTMEGIINRNGPKFYLLEKNIYFSDTGTTWMDILKSKGYKFVQLNSYSEIINLFGGYFKGIVTYDASIKNGWTLPLADIASVVASLTDAIPFNAQDAEIFSDTTGIPILNTININGKTLNAHMEKLGLKTPYAAFNWEFTNLAGACNKSEIMEVETTCMDYSVQKKMMYFSLNSSTKPEDSTLVNNIYTSLQKSTEKGYFIHWGYIDSQLSEDKETYRISKYGGVANLLSIANASLFAKLPADKTSFTQKTGVNIQSVKYDKSKVYVDFLASEPDGTKAGGTLQHGAWVDPNRGKVPISWGLVTSTVRDFPFLANYYFDTATSNDYFYTGSQSFVGGVNFAIMPAKARDAVIADSKIYSAKTDEHVIDFYSTYGYFSNWNESDYSSIVKSMGAFATTGSIANSGITKTQVKMCDNGIALINNPNLYPIYTNANVTPRQEILDKIVLQTKAMTTGFCVGYYGYIFNGDYTKNQFQRPIHTGETPFISPTDIKWIMDTLNASYPGKYKFVTLDEFAGAVLDSFK
jgi:hypothetical protein